MGRKSNEQLAAEAAAEDATSKDSLTVAECKSKNFNIDGEHVGVGFVLSDEKKADKSFYAKFQNAVKIGFIKCH